MKNIKKENENFFKGLAVIVITIAAIFLLFWLISFGL